MASRDKVDVDTFHKGIQYALERLAKSKFGFESTTVLNFKTKSHEGSGNELVDYSRAPCLGADQKARGLWEWDCISGAKNTALIFLEIFLIECCTVRGTTYDIITFLICIIQKHKYLHSFLLWKAFQISNNYSLLIYSYLFWFYKRSKGRNKDYKEIVRYQPKWRRTLLLLIHIKIPLKERHTMV